MELRADDPNPPREIELDVDVRDDEEDDELNELPLDRFDDEEPPNRLPVGVRPPLDPEVIGERDELPLEYVRGPVDGCVRLDPPPNPPLGIMIGPPEENELRELDECDELGGVVPEVPEVPDTAELAGGLGAPSSGLPHCRHNPPPSAISLMVLQFLQVTKYGCAGATGLFATGAPEGFCDDWKPQPGSNTAPTNSSGTSFDFFIVADMFSISEEHGTPFLFISQLQRAPIFATQVNPKIPRGYWQDARTVLT